MEQGQKEVCHIMETLSLPVKHFNPTTFPSILILSAVLFHTPFFLKKNCKETVKELKTTVSFACGKVKNPVRKRKMIIVLEQYIGNSQESQIADHLNLEMRLYNIKGILL